MGVLFFLFIFTIFYDAANATLLWIQDSSPISPPQIALYDQFGWSATMSADKLALGAYSDDGEGGGYGTVYTFQWSGTTWIQDDIVLSSPGTSGDAFSGALSMSGDKLAVGAIGNNAAGSTAGSVYTYTWNGTTWLLNEDVLIPDTLSAIDQFGYSVSMSGDKLAVSAVGDDGVDNNAGIVYTFQWNGTTWVQDDTTLAPSNLAANDKFGHAISMENDKMAISAIGDNSGAGAVYTYQWNGTAWVQDSSDIIPAGLQANDHFGQSVSLSGDKLVVGASGDDGTGTAYTFQWDGSTWFQDIPVLAPITLVTGNFFGFSLSLSGNNLAISAYRANTYAGVVYTFQWDGAEWIQDATVLSPTELLSEDRFGYALTMVGDNLVVGAIGDDGADINAGIVYSFSQVTPAPTMAPTTLQCPVCINGGVCVNFKCQCDYPYYGTTCEQVIDCNC